LEKPGNPDRLKFKAFSLLVATEQRLPTLAFPQEKPRFAELDRAE
jgi:hypothetical protein